MTLTYDLYWSFRSPYSYMVTPRLMALEAEHDVICNVRPVYPLAVRTPEFFDNRDPLWFSYFMTDVFREAAFLGLPFLKEVSHTIWSGEVQDWHEGDHLARAAERAGLDFAELDAAVAADPDRHIAVVEANQIAQRAAGHWGVPMMVFGGEPFFGQDRVDQMIWRMRSAGLSAR